MQFSGSAEDMLKQMGVDVPDQKPQSDDAAARAAKDKMGEPVFNDSDLQMAGYAAALKVLTAYTQIGGEDVTSFALRPKARGRSPSPDWRRLRPCIR